MQHMRQTLSTPEAWLTARQPDHPVLFFSAAALERTVALFRATFPGTLTYAVKANPDTEILDVLGRTGLDTFDVASPAEMTAVRGARVDAVLHYNNPVRSPAEIAAGVRARVASWSVDHAEAFEKLADVPRDTEISVRFALPVPGAAYDFGTKFGAKPEDAAALLERVAAAGFTPALCFHPGTQCACPDAWGRYIEAAAQIAVRARVRPARLNVGGGFAAHRRGPAPDVAALCRAIGAYTQRAFGADAPALLCEPGRAIVAEAGTLALRVKEVRGAALYLNDGLYGTLADLRDMSPPDRVHVMAADGTARGARQRRWDVFGPTCDSLDRLPDGWDLPADLEAGDFVLIRAMGAYSAAMATKFNGYGAAEHIWL